MTQPVAIFVDGDNISGKHAASILNIAAKHGETTVVRAYLDAKLASDWHASFGYRLVHAGSGKNAADILLALDAMELILSHGMKCFIIATSDGDFTHLALRLREYGATVIGVGESKAPRSFRAACSHFVELQTPQALKLVPQKSAAVTELDQKIRTIIAAHSKKGAGMRIAELAPKMHVQHGIRISTFPEKTWRGYLQARPALFDVDPRGPEAMVRFRQEGFVQVA
jgi:uncharacterized LabA/DUF88 family protein